MDRIPGGVAIWLNIPPSKRQKIKRQYRTNHDRGCQYSDYFLIEHPSPSWTVVCDALWIAQEHETLQLVQSLYLKGRLCMST